MDVIIDVELNQEKPIPCDSQRFNAQDADIIFESDDSVLFHIHRKYLEANTEGFPPAGFESRDKTVALSEHSTTLELLFQFVYPARHPDLASVDFEILVSLSEAAEKYQVYSAMVVCKIRMMGTLPKHAEEIMLYALKHDYPEIFGAAAPLLLNKPLEEMVMKLPPNLVIPWIRYNREWADCLEYAASESCYRGIIRCVGSVWKSKRNGPYILTHSHSQVCEFCSNTLQNIVVGVLTQLVKGTVSLGQLDNTFSPSFACCDHMKPALAEWRCAVELRMSKVPNFVTFI